MQLGDHLGFAGIVMGLIGIGITILWPTARWIGYACLVAALVLGGFWYSLAHRGSLETTATASKPTVADPRSPLVTPLASSPAPPKPSPREKPPKTPKPPELTLHYLYQHDFDGTYRLTRPYSVVEEATGTTIDFEAQVYMDFPARSKFIGVYFPHASPEETIKKCQIFSDFYQDFMNHMPESSSAFVGEEMMLSKDLVFSGRVFIYHEDLLTLEQRASLETLYKSRGLSVQFRGFSYLSGKALAYVK